MINLHLNLQSGAAGDMLLAALIDLGVDVEYIKDELTKLPINNRTLSTEKVTRAGIAANYVQVTDLTHTHKHDDSHTHHHHGAHRHLKDMLELVNVAPYSQYVKTNAEKVFKLLAIAEGKVHGKSPEDVHFHEVSGIDTIIDVFGVCLALEKLKINTITADNLFVGAGQVKCAHGIMPVPAPATLEILASSNIPWQSGPVEKELLTPTGAALLGNFCSEYLSFSGIAKKIGYGAGTADLAPHANLVTAILYEDQKTINPQTITEIRTSLDDITGEEAGHLLEMLYENSVLEAYYLPTIMKKSRPGFELVILIQDVDIEKIEALLFTNGITLGLRKRKIERSTLKREFQKVKVLGHEISIKLGFFKEKIVFKKAEYEDCKKVSVLTGKSLKEIQSLALNSL